MEVNLLSFRPVTARLRNKIRPVAPILQTADRVEELEPASKFEMEPAISLPNELDRVTGMIGDVDLHIARVNGGVREEGPTLSYEYHNALIADATVYAGGSYQVYREVRKRPVLFGTPDYFAQGQLCTTVCAQLYFGHFFHDGMPLEELAARRNVTPLTVERTPWLHEPGYRALFDRQAAPTALATVNRFSIVDERHLNQGWVDRFAALRRRLRDKITSTGAKQVFISRGKMFSGRSLANETEIAAELAKIGFSILEPEEEEPADIAAILCDADLVVCVGGSALVRALVALPPGATLLEIHLPPYFGTIGKLLTESAGLRWAYVVADADGERFTLQPKRLMQTLELVT